MARIIVFLGGNTKRRQEPRTGVMFWGDRVQAKQCDS